MTPEQQAVIDRVKQHLHDLTLSDTQEDAFENLLTLAKDLEKENKTLRGALIKRKEILMEEITDEEYDLLEGAS